MKFRYVAGALYMFIAIVFLVVNAIVLGFFGYKWGHDDWQKWGMAAVAALVPFALAPMPHIMLNSGTKSLYRRTWAQGFLSFLKNTTSFLALFLVYCLFVAYNILGGTGMAAWSRTETAESRNFVAEDTERRKNLLAEKRAELAAIPKHRPIQTIEATMSAHETHVYWKWTRKCTRLRNKRQRNYCAEYNNLIGEKAAAEQAAPIRAKIEALTLELGKEDRKTTTGDPQVRFIAKNTGWTEDQVYLLLLLATPITLEAGALILLSISLHLFGIKLDRPVELEIVDEHVPPRRMPPPPRRPSLTAGTLNKVNGVSVAPEDEDEPPEVLQTLAATQPPANPVKQRAVLDEFWRERTRKLDSGQVPEVTMYAHYEMLCRERDTPPFSQDIFAKLSAARAEAIVLSGQRFYTGVVVSE